MLYLTVSSTLGKLFSAFSNKVITLLRYDIPLLKILLSGATIFSQNYLIYLPLILLTSLITVSILFNLSNEGVCPLLI